MAIGEEAERRISAEKVLRDALGYVRRQWKAMLLFTAAAWGLTLLSIKAGGIEGYGFWPVLVALYLLESVFFRLFCKEAIFAMAADCRFVNPFRKGNVFGGGFCGIAFFIAVCSAVVGNPLF